MGGIDSMADQVVDAESRIAKLRIVIYLLVNNPIKASACRAVGGETESVLRRTFLDLYLDQDRVPSFPSMSACFQETDQERSVDRGLFIHLWRQWLEDGDLDTFDQEFRALLSQPGIFPGFFKKWRKETFRIIGNRALREMETCQERNEPEKASLIRDFLYQSGYFREETLGELDLSLLERIIPFKGKMMTLVLFVLTLWLTVYSRARYLSMEATFRSFYRSSRKKS